MTTKKKTRDDPRLFLKTPRDLEKWKVIYKRRTSVERSNKQEKIDYKLESGRLLSTMMWYMRIYGIMTPSIWMPSITVCF
ncbi:hypothetical protein BK133_03735 [Paenibacillus sp. FSL H8-0548]|uniref:hypothetical protein n=1 Tax=Paenibacillus sp. FSL H8-0548 TaxID=1920422 RepID=UPI00096F35E6|nr:hypothetical protein [Paenibacillus sp. FSL H8-0548]OMF38096.1 hypothetical protein BK133_03735 [Paenibacillus sp. FSL H8-0548]